VPFEFPLRHDGLECRLEDGEVESCNYQLCTYVQIDTSEEYVTRNNNILQKISVYYFRHDL
jgi:hypothetical protein